MLAPCCVQHGSGVDWLIKNAKDAIDKLETLPITTSTNASTHPDSAENFDKQAQAVVVAGH
jgi:HSP90 family molecular chaperone